MKQCPAELLCAHGYPGSSCGCYYREVRPTRPNPDPRGSPDQATRHSPEDTAET